MFATTDDRSEVRALLEHAALCLALGSALGFISGGFAALELDAFVALSKIVHYSIALVCIAATDNKGATVNIRVSGVVRAAKSALMIALS